MIQVEIKKWTKYKSVGFPFIVSVIAYLALLQPTQFADSV